MGCDSKNHATRNDERLRLDRQFMPIPNHVLRGDSNASTELERTPPPDNILAPTQQNFVSATEPDWSRESKPFFAWVPSRSLVASIRAYQRHSGRRAPWHWAAAKLAVLRYRFWSIVTAADIPITTQIAGGLLMPHPNGIVIHPACRIGPNCLLMQQVTLGVTRDGAPQLGGHVDIGAGAKVIGAITLGDHAVVGANAVVVNDVAPGSVVVGIPARPLVRSGTGASS
jgi:serine O-acetyltransferase